MVFPIIIKILTAYINYIWVNQFMPQVKMILTLINLNQEILVKNKTNLFYLPLIILNFTTLQNLTLKRKNNHMAKQLLTILAVKMKIMNIKIQFIVQTTNGKKIVRLNKIPIHNLRLRIKILSIYPRQLFILIKNSLIKS